MGAETYESCIDGLLGVKPWAMIFDMDNLWFFKGDNEGGMTTADDMDDDDAPLGGR